MSNKRYRQKPQDYREVFTDVKAAFENGDPVDYLKAQQATADLLRDLNMREALERREAKADTHGVDAAAAEAQRIFEERVAAGSMREEEQRLTKDDYLRIMENLFLKMNRVSTCAMYAIDAVNEREAHRAFARDVAMRAASHERPARAHPLMGLSNLVVRCARIMIQIVSITQPELVRTVKAAAKSAAESVADLKAAAAKVHPSAAS